VLKYISMKKIIIFLISLFSIFSGLYLYRHINQPKVQQSVKKIHVSQAITTKDKNSDFVSYQIEEGKTALDLLKISKKIETKGEGVNAYVVSIDGRKAENENREYWAFYVNGKMANVGAGSYQLKNGDKIEWKIEKY